MRKCFLLLVSVIIYGTSFSQEEEMSSHPLINKENLFTGGTGNFSFGDQITAVGLSPFFGYSFNKYIDVAASFGVDYIAQRDYNFLGDKLRQTIYTPGIFTRVFPAKFLFGQAQLEYNIIKYNYIPALGSNLNSEKVVYQAKSILLGAGISNGKDFPVQKSYYYFSILWDVGKDVHSPYKDNLNRAIPIIRAGYNIALFQGKQ